MCTTTGFACVNITGATTTESPTHTPLSYGRCRCRPRPKQRKHRPQQQQHNSMGSRSATGQCAFAYCPIVSVAANSPLFAGSTNTVDEDALRVGEAVALTELGGLPLPGGECVTVADLVTAGVPVRGGVPLGVLDEVGVDDGELLRDAHSAPTVMSTPHTDGVYRVTKYTHACCPSRSDSVTLLRNTAPDGEHAYVTWEMRGTPTKHGFFDDPLL